MRSARAVLLLLLASFLPAVALAQRPAAAARHVVVISIDGLRPDYDLRSPTRLTKTPVLDALGARGSWAKGDEASGRGAEARAGNRTVGTRVRW